MERGAGIEVGKNSYDLRSLYLTVIISLLYSIFLDTMNDMKDSSKNLCRFGKFDSLNEFHHKMRLKAPSYMEGLIVTSLNDLDKKV